MLKAGITGGIGSGKSIVCEVFKQFGVPVYKADTEASILIDTSAEIKNKLTGLFGEDIYNGHKLRRDRFSDIIFNSKEALEKVNSIVHPAVISHFINWSATHTDKNYVLFEAAILIESGTYKLMDKIIAVTAPEKLRVSRVLDSKKFTKKIINNIIKSQLPESRKVKHANYIIDNDGKTLILPQILEIHNKLVNIDVNK